jgi:2-polyprenyl-3-methyl-5-hydroxy-6-metoxy-1,4-benzoquinol methylase
MTMSEPSSSQSYILGHTPAEIQRLLLQGQLLNPFTVRLLTDAGVSRGMKVLDVGCGPGDVSLIAAELVGETGHILGVDSNATVLELAQARAKAAGLSQVSFLQADLHDLSFSQSFDAIVGRLILQHVPDRVAVLRHLLTSLRPGGLVAFQELDIPPQDDAAMPASALWQQTTIWVWVAANQAGIEMRMGMKLSATLLSAGLPVPQLRYEAAIGAGPLWAGPEYWAEMVRNLEPLIMRFGLATTEELGIETLAARLREEHARLGGTSRLPALVSAWTHTAQQ